MFTLLLPSSFKPIRSWCNALNVALCLFVFVPLPVLADNFRVLLVLSDSSAPYQSFAKTFAENLPATLPVAVLEHAEEFTGNVPKSDLIVTVGVKASSLVAPKTNTPLLAAMLPKSSYEDLLGKQRHGKDMSAIYLDQPWERQADFLHILLPGRNKIGLLYSSLTRLDLAELHKEIARHDSILNAQLLSASDSLFDALEALLDNSDVLLAVPDHVIYSSNNIRNILLTTYRRGVPLIGLSQSYVNAGALGAIFSTPEQIAAQASAIVMTFSRSHQLPDAQYPILFTIAVNQEVARTLSVPIQSPEMVRLQMDDVKRKMR